MHKFLLCQFAMVRVGVTAKKAVGLFALNFLSRSKKRDKKISAAIPNAKPTFETTFFLKSKFDIQHKTRDFIAIFTNS